MIKFFTPATFAAAAAGMLATAAPATALPAFSPDAPLSVQTGAQGSDYSRRHDNRRHDRHYRNYRGSRHYDERVTRNTRVWRGNDGRYYCRRSNGTTGLIIGGALGALLGREIDGGYNRSTGTILGAAGGALLGRSIDRGDSRCR